MTPQTRQPGAQGKPLSNCLLRNKTISIRNAAVVRRSLACYVMLASAKKVASPRVLNLLLLGQHWSPLERLKQQDVL